MKERGLNIHTDYRLLEQIVDIIPHEQKVEFTTYGVTINSINDKVRGKWSRQKERYGLKLLLKSGIIIKESPNSSIYNNNAVCYVKNPEIIPDNEKTELDYSPLSNVEIEIVNDIVNNIRNDPTIYSFNRIPSGIRRRLLTNKKYLDDLYEILNTTDANSVLREKAFREYVTRKKETFLNYMHCNWLSENDGGVFWDFIMQSMNVPSSLDDKQDVENVNWNLEEMILPAVLTLLFYMKEQKEFIPEKWQDDIIWLFFNSPFQKRDECGISQYRQSVWRKVITALLLGIFDFEIRATSIKEKILSEINQDVYENKELIQQTVKDILNSDVSFNRQQLATELRKISQAEGIRFGWKTHPIHRKNEVRTI